MNKDDTEIIGRVIRTEMDILRAEFTDAIAVVATAKMIPGPVGPAGERGAVGADGIAGETVHGDPGSAGKDGANGVDGKDATATDGRDGRDGKDGRDGADAFELPIADGIEQGKTYPRGALATDQGALWRYNGTEWKCLVDGLASVELTYIDDRTLQVKQVFASGKTTETAYPVPALIYQEIFNAEKDYVPGDFVTYNGSMWGCIEPTKAVPGTKDGGWRLAVKRGLNGRSK